LENLQACLLHLALSQHLRLLVKEQEHAAFDAAKEADAIVTLFTLLISSHNFFYGQTAILKEQTDVRHKHDYFSRNSPEVLQHFKLRWDDMIKEAARVGIDGELSDKSRFYHFSFALVKYGLSDLVRRESAQRAAISMSTQSTTSRIIIRNAFALHESTPTRPQGPPT
jgi:hypothetical protein